MKTLDEVIGILERQIDKTRIKILDKDLLDSVPDALHYLKEYRKNQSKAEKARELYLGSAEELDALRDYWAEQQANPALTWDELRSMEGKPVWIEVGLLRPRWFLIEGFNGEQMIGVDALSVRVPFYEDAFYTGGCKAYRKERE